MWVEILPSEQRYGSTLLSIFPVEKKYMNWEKSFMKEFHLQANQILSLGILFYVCFTRRIISLSVIEI